jgi:hypothetical protein
MNEPVRRPFDRRKNTRGNQLAGPCADFADLLPMSREQGILKV